MSPGLRSTSSSESIRVGSLLLYPTGRQTPADRTVCNFILGDLKNASDDVVQRLARRAADVVHDSELGEVLLDAGTLVPVPRSAPHQQGSLWVPELIARELAQNQEVAGVVQPLIRRVKAVPKSGQAQASLRPTVQVHCDSLEVVPPVEVPERITLVDDVVTWGRTTIACKRLLEEAFPGVEVRAFALARVVRVSINDTKEMWHPMVTTLQIAHPREWTTYDLHEEHPDIFPPQG